MFDCIRLVRLEDIPQITEIDREAFPTMLPPINYQRELKSPLAHYIVACDGKKPVDGALVKTAVGEKSEKPLRSPASGNEVAPPCRQYVVAFAGLWMMAGEAHIVNIAVRQSFRRRGTGELLLIALIDMAIELEASLILLEVRASNAAAIRLYHKYGFTEIRLRRGYYADNKEDGVVMTAQDIGSASFHDNLNRLKQAHHRKWGTTLYEITRQPPVV